MHVCLFLLYTCFALNAKSVLGVKINKAHTKYYSFAFEMTESRVFILEAFRLTLFKRIRQK